MATARNLFVNGSVTTNYSRPLYNPVIGTGGGGAGGGGGGGSCDLALIDTKEYNNLYTIEHLYGDPLSNKNYEQISSDYNQYIILYNQVLELIKQATDKRLIILLKLAKETLEGAINAYALYGLNVSLTFDKTNLQNTINTILSGKNEHMVATATGQLSITKTFKLANVFNCYLIIYGMPMAGIGFDPVKINFLVKMLKQHGIDPYK
jgi:hypothetical protein